MPPDAPLRTCTASSWGPWSARELRPRWWSPPGPGAIRPDRTGPGRAAAGDRLPAGPAQFSFLLLQVAIGLTSLILVANLLLHRPVIESLLFSLAIAVGITPQLLPAVVSTSLATGTRQLARRKVLVKRLVCIEDLGDMDVLVTDKTGTLTEGRISFIAALDPAGAHRDRLLALGSAGHRRRPRRRRSQRQPAGRRPVGIAIRRRSRRPRARRALDALPSTTSAARPRRWSATPGGDRTACWSSRARRNRCSPRAPTYPAARSARWTSCSPPGAGWSPWPARPADGSDAPSPRPTRRACPGRVPYLRRPAQSRARASLAQLAALGIEVKVATGDNPRVAEKVCAEIGLVVRRRSAARRWTRLDEPTRPPVADSHDLRPRLPGAEGADDHAPRASRAARWAFSATGSTTPWPCTPPTSASRSTPPPTSPRTPPTSSCWRRTSAYWPTASWRAGASSPTPSSTY